MPASAVAGPSKRVPTVNDAMTSDCTILIVEHMDLLLEALVSFIRKIAPHAHIVHIRELDRLIEEADRAADYALIVLDGDLPGLAALPSADALLQKLGRAHLALLAANFPEGGMSRVIRNSVNAYLPKYIPGPVIIAGLALALSGQNYFPEPNPLIASPDQGASGRAKLDFGDGKDPPKRITPRQAEILALLAEGKTNSEIAHALGLAESTIRLHLREAYRRLGVRNRIQAVRETLRLFPQNSQIN